MDIRDVIGFLIVMLVTLAGAGLYKPWWVLWWMARQTRKKVLLWYGIPAATLAAIRLLLP